MPQDVNAKLQVYAKNTLYIGTASNDLSYNIFHRMTDLAATREMTARLKAMIVAAGTSN